MSLVRCGVCSHARREAIEQAAARSGVELVDVAREFGIAEAALRRHVDNSHPRAPATEAKTKKRAKAASPAGRARRVPSSVQRTSLRSALVTLAPPASSESSATVEQAPRGDDAEEEAPATSRSSELGRPRTARERLEGLLDRIEKLLADLDRDKKVGTAAKLEAHRSLVTAIRLLAQFTGEVGASETSVAASPFYRRVRTAIVEALRPKEHRPALEAIIAALDALEGGNATTEAAAE
jgi:transposase-like protein